MIHLVGRIATGARLQPTPRGPTSPMAAAAAVVALLLLVPPLASQDSLAANSLQAPYAPALSAVTDPELREDLAAALEDGPRLPTKRVSELLARWRDADDGPASGTGWALVARLWRQAGEPDSTFRALERADRAGGAPAGLLSLEEARSAFLAGRPEVGAEAYWEGCQEADFAVLTEYRRDFAPVETPAEAAEWDELLGATGASVAALPDGACGLLRRAWGERASRAGLPVPDRLALHYRRLRHARQHYWLVRTGMRLGPRTRLLAVQVGRPEAVPFDDRGLIYMRLGEPDRRTGFLGAGANSQKVDVGDECFQPNESWAYDYPDGTRVYHFSSLEGTADWWLIENLHYVQRCGTLYALPDLYRSRMGLDPFYGTLAARLSAAFDTAHNLVRRQLFFEERHDNFRAAEAALTVIPDRPAVRADVPLLYELLQFRAPDARSSGPTRVWLNAVAEGRRLEGEPLESGGLQYRVRAQLSLVDAEGELRRRETEFSLVAAEELEGDTGIPVRLPLELPPGEYGYTLAFRDANDERERPAGNWRTDSLRVTSYAARVPQLSDVAFAPDSGGGWSPAPGVALPASPVHRTKAAGRAWLYFEAYGLSPAGDYVTEVRLEPEGRGEPFTLTYPGAPPASEDGAVRRVLRLELGDTEPGEYEARITVTDALGRTTLPLETSLTVTAGGGRR